MTKVIVIGTGYVGLPLAIMLAREAYEVVGVDIDENVVKAINDKNLLEIADADEVKDKHSKLKDLKKDSIFLYS